MKLRFFDLVLLVSVFIMSLEAKDHFAGLNPPLTEKMKENRRHAKVCKRPAVAEEKFDRSFRYGCFCGENYPNIKDPSLKPPEYLTYSRRKALIARYYSIKPYDTIDEACMKHDICYIYNGTDNPECDDAFYATMRDIYDAFDRTKEGKEPGTKAWRCKILASDMGAIFRTIFTASDETSGSRFVFFSMLTPFAVATKVMQKSAISVSERSGYPLPFEKCTIRLEQKSDKPKEQGGLPVRPASDKALSR